MAPNGTAYPSLPSGNFLFTSESVGEGHPGMLNASCSMGENSDTVVQIKFATRSPMPLSVVNINIFLFLTYMTRIA